MKKLFLVRYGDYDDKGQINEGGVLSMTLVYERIKPFISNQNVHIICAKVLRAISSAEVISQKLNIFPVESFIELYAEDKNIPPSLNIPVNLEKAMKVINSEGEKCDILIAVISREYIELIPNHILNSLDSTEIIETHLSGGEVLILDYNEKNITYLR